MEDMHKEQSPKVWPRPNQITSFNKLKPIIKPTKVESQSVKRNIPLLAPKINKARASIELPLKKRSTLDGSRKKPRRDSSRNMKKDKEVKDEVVYEQISSPNERRRYK